MTYLDTSVEKVANSNSLRQTMTALGQEFYPLVLQLAELGVAELEISPGVYLRVRNIEWEDVFGDTVEMFAYCLNNTPFAVIKDHYHPKMRVYKAAESDTVEVMGEFFKEPHALLNGLKQQIQKLKSAKVETQRELDKLYNPSNPATVKYLQSKDAPLTWRDLRSWLDTNYDSLITDLDSPVGIDCGEGVHYALCIVSDNDGTYLSI